MIGRDENEDENAGSMGYLKRVNRDGGEFVAGFFEGLAFSYRPLTKGARGMALWSTVAVGAFFVQNALAQVGTDQASSALCGSTSVDIARLVTIVLGILSGWFVLKAIPRAQFGLDKMGSTNEQTVREGKSQARGAGYSVGAAVVPVLFIAGLEAAGIGVVSCMMPSV